jgi:hypothetical protein
MLARFPRLSKLAIKILEIGGAGVASAVAASLLGTAHEPARAPESMPPAIVRLAPADEQMIRHVRDESVALVEKLRTAADAQSTVGAASGPTASPAPAAAGSIKPAKVAAGAPPRRDQKPTRVQAEARQHTPEPAAAPAAGSLTTQRPASLSSNNDVRDGRVTAVAAAPNDWTPTPAQVPSRLWSGSASSVRDAPRPPVGVGEFVSSSM